MPRHELSEARKALYREVAQKLATLRWEKRQDRLTLGKIMANLEATWKAAQAGNVSVNPEDPYWVWRHLNERLLPAVRRAEPEDESKQCSSCGVEGLPLTFFQGFGRRDELLCIQFPGKLCPICASTLFGNECSYAYDQASPRAIAAALGVVLREILALRQDGAVPGSEEKIRRDQRRRDVELMRRHRMGEEKKNQPWPYVGWPDEWLANAPLDVAGEEGRTDG